MKRRDFLSHSAATYLGLSGLASMPFLSHAQNILTAKDKTGGFLVFVTIESGWDTSLATDPWTTEQRPDSTDYFIEHRADQLQGTKDFLMGPAMESLKNFFPQMAIINGVISGQTDNGHEAHRLYMKTGSGSGANAEFTAVMDHFKGDSKLGVLSQGAGIHMANFNVATTDASTLAYLNSANEFKSFSKRKSPIENAKTLLLKYSDDIENLRKRIQQIKSEKNAEIQSDSGFLANAVAIASAFELGLARSSSMTVSPNQGSLDTHGAHESTHLAALSSVFARLSGLFQLFKGIPSGKNGESLFDKTTFVVTSEFSRTPALNASLGKDHNPQTNSVILAGAGIRGLQKIGASRLVTRKEAQGTPYMIGTPFDYQTGQALQSPENAEAYIQPENIIVTLEKRFGIPKSWSPLQIRGFKEIKGVLS
jgi:uncharacterized protein (DUF1501 family)